MPDPNQKKTETGWGPEVAPTPAANPNAPSPSRVPPAAGAGGDWGPEVSPDSGVEGAQEPMGDEPHFYPTQQTFADKANEPLLDQNTILKGMTFGKMDRQRLTSTLNNLQSGLVYKRGRWVPVGAPIEADPNTEKGREIEQNWDAWKSQHMLSSLGNSISGRISSLTNPVGIGMSVANKAAKIPYVGRAIKAGANALGVGFAAEGGKDLSDLYETTPEGSVPSKLKFMLWDEPRYQERALNDLANVVSGIPALHDLASGIAGVPQAITPNAYQTGERAILNAIAPGKGRPSERVREAYGVVAKDLFREAANPKSPVLQGFEGFRDWTRNMMKSVAVEASDRVRAANSGQPYYIDPLAIRNGIDSSVTKYMEYTRTPSKQVFRTRGPNGGYIMKRGPATPSPAEAAILNFADNVSQNIFDKPLDLEGAENMVQELNQRTGSFYAQSKAKQREAIMNGDPIVAELALKNALQGEIDKVVSQYRDLKMKYGAYKQLSEATQARMDSLDSKPTANTNSRRVIENAAGGAGFLIGGSHGGPHGGLATSVAAYKLSQALADAYVEHMKNPERMLRRAAQGPSMVERFANRPAQMSGPLNLIQAAAASGKRTGDDIDMNAIFAHVAAERGGMSQLRVISPDGRRGTIPYSDREKALRKGYRILD